MYSITGTYRNLPQLSLRRRSVRLGHRLTVMSADMTSFRRSIPARTTSSRRTRGALTKKTLAGLFLFVRPAGIEPTSLVPKTSVLSVELRAQTL